MFAKLEEKLYVGLKMFAFLLMLMMVAVIFSQVIARYALGNSLSWSEEIGHHLFVWMTFLGAALAVRNKAHVALDLFINLLPQKVQKLPLLLSFLVMMIFAAVLIHAGVQMITLGSRQISAALQLPMKYVYIILPVSGTLIIFYLLKNLYEALAARR